MQLNIQKSGSAWTLGLTGDFSFNDNDQIRTAVESITADHPNDVTVELSGLSNMDSAGLGMLLLLKDAVDEVGGKIRLKGPSGQVARLLDVSRYGELMDIN
ncbi:MAG: STAS domain-containing protein [Magnetovibrionaceae bacterium]